MRSAREPVFVEALISEATIKALDIRIVDRLTRADERQTNATRVRPGIQHTTFELGSMIDGNGYRKAAVVCQPSEYCSDPRAGDRRVDLKGEAFPTVSSACGI